MFNSFLGIHFYGAVKKEYDSTYAISYYIGPFMAGILGVAFYGMIKGGIGVLTGDFKQIESVADASFSYLGIGFLIGLSWLKVVIRLFNVSTNMFGIDEKKQESIEMKKSLGENS